MDTKKISAMDPAATFTGAEMVEIVQSGSNKRGTTSQFAALVASGTLGWGGLWNFAGNGGDFPSVDEGVLYIAEDDHGSPGDGDYVAAGSWFISITDGATVFADFSFK
jgi:hypothetical protein